MKKDVESPEMRSGAFQRHHGGFQFGKNPMEMTEFEKAQVAQEKLERFMAKQRYVAGIQGTDGGKCCC